MDAISTNRPARAGRIGLAALLLFALTLLGLVATPATGPAFADGTETLQIETKSGAHTFNIEIAETAAERAKGLMFRRRIADDYGMLFDFSREEFVTMWMRNTYVSLDMIFAFDDGTIHRIEAETEPFSERTIPSGRPVRYVLEIRGGRASELGIAPGDRLVGDSIGK